MLNDKPVAVIGARVVDRGFPVPRAHKAFNENGDLIDAEAASDLGAHLAELMETAGGPAGSCSDQANYSRQCQLVAG